MTSSELRAKLEHLHALVLRERDAARTFDMPLLTAVTKEKEILLLELGGHHEMDEDLADLAEKIREENRRNAYLFWSGLTLVRETMEFFEKQVPPPGYGARGSMAQSNQGGKLISGRI